LAVLSSGTAAHRAEAARSRDVPVTGEAAHDPGGPSPPHMAGSKLLRPGEADAMITPMKFVGGFNSPGRLGRRNATWPFGELQLESGAVQLRSTLGWTNGQQKVRFLPADVSEAFLCRNLMFGRGVAFQLHDGTEFYFWTIRGATATKILDELAREGFSTSVALRWALFMRARRRSLDLE